MNKAKFIFRLITIFLLTFFLYFSLQIKPTSIPIISKIERVEKLIIPEKTKTYKISLLATGDTVIHDDVRNYALKSDGSYDFKPYFSEIKDIVSKYDLAYYNQECVFGGLTLGYSSYPRFNCPSEVGDAMLDTGFNLVSLANNHSFDKGEKGVLNTLKYWESTKVTYDGLSSSDEDRNNYKIVTKNNITYGFLSYTYGTNGLAVPENKNYLVHLYSDEQAKEDIDAIKDKVDVIIVAMHWGTEYTKTPTEAQRQQAKYLASLGVNIIIGNHPHVLQPIEWIDKTLVIYSLGNLISNQGILSNKIGYDGVVGAMATCDISKTIDDKTSKITIDNLKVQLIYTYKNTQEKYYKVIPFSKLNDTYLKDYQNIFQKYQKVIQTYDNTIKVN